VANSVSVDTSGLEKWAKSIYTALNAQTVEFSIAIPIKYDVKEKSVEDITRLMQILADPAFYESLIVEFMEIGLAQDYFRKEYYKAAQSRAYLPEYKTWRDGVEGNTGYDTAMTAGIRAVAREITKVSKPRYGSDGSSIHIHMGDIESLTNEQSGLKLNKFMGLKTGDKKDRKVNNLFMAVEFGTGVADKVGNSSFVRNAPNKETDGSWFMNPAGKAKGGIQFMGQGAVGMIWDKGNRGKNEELISYIEDNLGPFIQSMLKAKLK